MDNQADAINQIAARPGEDVADEIHAIRHLFKRQRYAGQQLGDHELTHMEARVIFFVDNRPGATQSDAVTHFGRDKASAHPAAFAEPALCILRQRPT